MPLSQNLLFTADAPEDAAYPHPPGAGLMRLLAAGMRDAGWNVGERENWRDSGWRVICRHGHSELEVSLARIPNGLWMLQAAPLRVPGFIGRLFGETVSAAPPAVYALALAAHEALAARGLLRDPRWLWDGYPDEGESTPEPPPPPSG